MPASYPRLDMPATRRTAVHSSPSRESPRARTRCSGGTETSGAGGETHAGHSNAGYGSRARAIQPWHHVVMPSEPVLVHRRQKLSSNRIPRLRPNHGVDLARRTQSGLADVFPLIDPFGDCRRRKDRAAIEAAATGAGEHFGSVMRAVAMGANNVGRGHRQILSATPGGRRAIAAERRTGASLVQSSPPGTPQRTWVDS